MKEELNQDLKERKFPKLLIIILIVLLVASIVAIIILGIQCKNEKEKREDIKELLSFYENTKQSVDYIHNYSESLTTAWDDYIMNGEYSDLSDMLESLNNSESNTLDLIDTFKDMATSTYKCIKKDNYYYQNNSEIKEQVKETFNTFTEYYDFILDNKELSYFTLKLQNESEYTLSNTSLGLLMLTIINNVK